jgi:alkyldihydroxyacetonephosphate synthase
MLIGSEGILGVITEAWMRVRPRPIFRATATTHFASYERAVDAVRALSQSGLYPSNCRLLDKREAALNAVTMDGTHVLVIGFESADHPLRPWMERALELVGDHEGTCPKGPAYRESGERSGQGAGDGAGAWREAFIDMPYLLNVMASMGIVADTFETACTWDNFERLHTNVIAEARRAMKDACGAGFISCRFTHVYPDGPAPYFTFIAPGRYGAEAEQWMTIKQAASDAVLANGGTITHHHAVGRVHRPWYDRQRPALFADALRGAKRSLDPEGVLNPGVLVGP